MPFNPDVNQAIDIEGQTYIVAEHPLAPDIPYGQEGRQAIVYQILPKARPMRQKNGASVMALKVFKPVYRSRALVELCDKLKPLNSIPGLTVCNRQVLTEDSNKRLLAKHPDLTFAMLMPWIQGPTWLDILIDSQELTQKQSFELAHALASTLTVMEQQYISHGDLSSPNLMLPGLLVKEGESHGSNPLVELVDVEQLFHRSFDQPDSLPAGSPGYAHRTASQGLWGPDADRFAGAVLIAEILAWCSPELRAESWGESYFDPGEMQEKCERYSSLSRILNELWGSEVSGLFDKAWFSQSLADCPRFSEWQYALNTGSPPGKQTPGELNQVTIQKHEPSPGHSLQPEARVLTNLGRNLINLGNLTGAVEAYRYAQEFIDNETDRLPYQKIIADLQNTIAQIDNSALPQQTGRAPSLSCSLMRDGDEGREPIQITKELFVIGRGVNADYQEVLPGVSRIHMEVITAKDGFAVRDLNSTNGTFLNGQRLVPYVVFPVTNGDRIQIAEKKFIVAINTT
ncbi:MAG: FHA domain-containing protein [Syntrophomonas sp.]